MFDGFHQAARDDATTADDGAHLPDDVRRLCARYDSLLSDADAPLDNEARDQLKALAAIYDLDTGRAPNAVWRELRGVLVRQSPAAGAESATLPPAPPITVMVVEDDPVIAADLTESLLDAGHGVVGPFQSAEAALASAGLQPLDLALIDINLSAGGSGVELARSLRDAWGLPVMFLSGDVTTAARHAELAAALVIKPFRGSEVLEAIDRAVARGAIPA